MYSPPLLPLDLALLHLVEQTPAAAVFDEPWFRQQLEQAGHPDPVVGLQWALMAGLLHVRGLSATGHWQLARATAPPPATAQPPLYVPARAYEELPGGTCYPALPEALAARLAAARFPFTELGEDAPVSYTLAQLAQRLGQPSEADQATREALDAAGPLAVYYRHHLPRISFGEAHWLAAVPVDEPAGELALDVLHLTFEPRLEPQAALNLLTGDLVLANHLLFLHAPAPGAPLTVLVRLPAGEADPVATLEALPAYCRQRFQAQGGACQSQNPQRPARVVPGGVVWLHPTLRRLA